MPNPTHRLVGVIEWDASWDALVRDACSSPPGQSDSEIADLDYAVCEFTIRRTAGLLSLHSPTKTVVHESILRADTAALIGELESELDEFLCSCQ